MVAKPVQELAPLTEEIAFRGYAMGLLRRHFGSISAIVVSDIVDRCGGAVECDGHAGFGDGGVKIASNWMLHRYVPGKAQACQGSRKRISGNLATITPRRENKLRTRAIKDEFSVAGDCATLRNIIDSFPAD